jgi:nucleotide-binding universal stress UspA family protein
MVNATHAAALLDLAFLIRALGSDEPLRPLTVVRGSARQTAEGVAKAERMLSHAVAYASGANVPANPLTRVDHNFAEGIVRGMAESGATTVVAGWDGLRSRRSGIVGDVLDQVLERTEQLVLVAKIEHPLNVTRRIVLILPEHIDRSRGFYEAMRTVKRMANRLGANLLAVSVAADAEAYRKQLEEVKPEVPVTFDTLSGWENLDAELRSRLQDGDVVVLVSARRRTIAWQRELDGMPRKLASLVPPESFVVVYPSESEPPVRENEPGLTQPDGNAPFAHDLQPTALAK